MTAPNGPSQSNSSKVDPAAQEPSQEPSMDDILASIRRIIADDDALPLSRTARSAVAPQPTQKEAPSSSAPPPTVTTAANALLGLGQRLFRSGEAGKAGEPSVSAFRPPSGRPAPAAPSSPEPPKTPMLKLRDFAPIETFGLRPSLNAAADSARGGPDGKPAESVEAVKAPEPESASISNIAEARLKIAPLRPAAPASVEQAQTADSPAQVASEPAQVAPSTPEPVAVEAEKPQEAPILSASRRVPAPPPVAAPLPAVESEPALLSPASGARIGASFEALAESLMLRDPQMLERVARDMLRPMLKTWLDDNLPIVVERLVRAEIERIARGR
jgi:cell pole-organizing protein PopZ